MGKWCEVKCNCSNREPLPNSSEQHEPNRNKRKNKQQAEQAKQWRETIYRMYKCGHRDGRLIETLPNDWLRIGRAINAVYKEQTSTFEIFSTIANYENYVDEKMKLTIEQAELWILEIDQLNNYCTGKELMDKPTKLKWERYWSMNELYYGSIEETLHDARSVCNASIQTGNPIELYW